MFCPDCGHESIGPERFCNICGFPLGRLKKRLDTEEQAALGWAEKIVGKPKQKTELPPDAPVISYSTGREQQTEVETEGDRLRCERCGTKVALGIMCPACGDKLPMLSESDHFLPLVLAGLWRMLVAPRHFALNLGYPVKGGTIQPILYSGVFAALFILTLPLSRPELLFETENPVRPVATALVGLVFYVLGIPPLVYLTGGLIHWIAVILGGRAPFRRTLRVAAAGFICLMILGIVRNIIIFAFYFPRPFLVDFLAERIGVDLSEASAGAFGHLLFIALIIFAGWQFAWLFGGLHRLAWWKTMVHFLATYMALLWWFWILIMIVIPYRVAGFL